MGQGCCWPFAQDLCEGWGAFSLKALLVWVVLPSSLLHRGWEVTTCSQWHAGFKPSTVGLLLEPGRSLVVPFATFRPCGSSFQKLSVFDLVGPGLFCPCTLCRVREQVDLAVGGTCPTEPPSASQPLTPSGSPSPLTGNLFLAPRAPGFCEASSWKLFLSLSSFLLSGP